MGKLLVMALKGRPSRSQGAQVATWGCNCGHLERQGQACNSLFPQLFLCCVGTLPR